MKVRRKNCKYCKSKIITGTTRKVFCTDKCRVYYNREIKSNGNANEQAG